MTNKDKPTDDLREVLGCLAPLSTFLFGIGYAAVSLWEHQIHPYLREGEWHSYSALDLLREWDRELYLYTSNEWIGVAEVLDWPNAPFILVLLTVMVAGLVGSLFGTQNS
ncbi:MAG: hypothetical protein NXH85_07675 [Pseudomonadaceae bacterium]|nr:hypothetical protein [Pseudomonadaceae bacterium]